MPLFHYTRSTNFTNSDLLCATLLFVVPVSFIKRCKYADSKCYKQSADDAIPIFALGIPELGVKSLDPITFKTLDASSSSLKFVVNDVKIKGLKHCKAKKVS